MTQRSSSKYRRIGEEAAPSIRLPFRGSDGLALQDDTGVFWCFQAQGLERLWFRDLLDGGAYVPVPLTHP